MVLGIEPMALGPLHFLLYALIEFLIYLGQVRVMHIISFPGSKEETLALFLLWHKQFW